MAIARNARSDQEDSRRGLGSLEKRCPVRTSLDVLRGRWKPTILEQLYASPARYNELLAAIDGVSQQALTMQLRQLVADDVITRGKEDLRYRLTQRGDALSEIMEGLEAWGTDYLAWRSSMDQAGTTPGS